MASSYPGGLDALTNPTGSDSMASVSHASQHANANDAIEAIQAELGTDPSGASATVAARFDTKVTKAASSTDNALARFDGTGGDTVQNSGITVNDSGQVSSDLTVSKADPGVIVAATSGGANMYFSAAASGQSANLRFQTNSSSRWIVGKDGTAEAGSNAGSHLGIYARTDAGAALRTDLLIARDTGKWTFGSVGASAGLELGASGPRVMSGTGSPEGVVTAPVGSMWTDTAATTGAIRWVKASGTGNTGWVVEYGDTGLRDVTSLLTGAHTTLNPNAIMTLRRVNSTVTITYANGASPTATGLQTLTNSIPVGFQYTSAASGRTPTGIMIVSTSGAGSTVSFYMGSSAILSSGIHVSGTRVQGSISFTTDDAWPSSLPGSAA